MRFIFLLASLLYIARADKRCFNAQGIAITDGSFVPCNSTATESACCASNKGNGDICIQGGLCYAQQGSYSGYIYANGCTDSTFSDASCPYACPMAKQNGWKSYNVLPCVLDQWCCREASDRTNCCNNSSMIINSDQTSYLGQFINVIPGTSTSDDSNSTNAAATTTVTSTVTATPSSDSGNTTTVVGAAVGAVLGVACIVALAGLIWMMRRVKSLKKEMQSLRSQESYSSSNAPMPQQPYNPPQSTAPAVHTYEADWDNGRYEIDSTGK